MLINRYDVISTKLIKPANLNNFLTKLSKGNPVDYITTECPDGHIRGLATYDLTKVRQHYVDLFANIYTKPVHKPHYRTTIQQIDAIACTLTEKGKYD